MISFGQGWENTYVEIYNEAGHYVQQTTDGRYIITGSTESFGKGDGIQLNDSINTS